MLVVTLPTRDQFEVLKYLKGVWHEIFDIRFFRFFDELVFNCPQVSPWSHFEFLRKFSEIFERKTDSWKKAEVENLVSDSLSRKTRLLHRLDASSTKYQSPFSYKEFSRKNRDCVNLTMEKNYMYVHMYYNTYLLASASVISLLEYLLLSSDRIFSLTEGNQPCSVKTVLIKTIKKRIVNNDTVE